MSKIFVAVAGVLLSAGAASAADLRELAPPPRPLWNWTGFYIGGHIGGAFGYTSIADPLGAAIFGNVVRTPSVSGGAQLGYNWQLRRNWVFGVEADASALNGDGTNTCLASSGSFISANCQVKQAAMGSLTGRVGYATGAGGRTLYYAKGGAAWLSEDIHIVANGFLNPTSLSDNKIGWTVGIGVEQALAPAWSVKLEYDYSGFGSSQLVTPESSRQVGAPARYPTGFVDTPQGSASASQNIQTVKVGLNMKFGADAYARWDELDGYHLRGSQRAEPVASLGEIEIGGRVWYSSGRFQKDLGATVDQPLANNLISRLSYQNDAVSGELFGRVDSPSNVFLKGFVGGGKIVSGKMNDEDWIAGDGIPYSNTLSDPVKGNIGYLTVDAGYAFLRGDGFKVGGFLGYNYYQDNKSAYGCNQIGGANAICGTTVPASTLVISEDNKWNSLRIGVNGVVTLGSGVKLTADAAYLPYVKFTGVDTHPLRTDVANKVSPESGTGQGVQLETILSYAFTPSFSVGAGGRYWAMWATTDTSSNTFSLGCPCQTLPARTERYGGFLQASYTFDVLR